MLLGVDVGGTFTDAALFDGERLQTAKVPTTPADQAEGVIAAIEAACEKAGTAPEAIESFAHGMTVGTNALLTGTGARTALIATAGFADLLEIGRQNRPSLYHLCTPKPEPLVPAELKFEADERAGPGGVVKALADEDVDRLVSEVKDAAPESVAICLLFSYLDPSHESRLAERLRAELPGLHVSASHEVLPQFREYERCSTTVIDAYLSPLLGRYLDRLARACRERDVPEPTMMRSSGGVAPAAEAAKAGAWSVLSGPAGGAVGAGVLARASGDGNALGFDMGGTSCDVCVVEEGRVRRTDARELAGRPIQLPMVDVHTVGAGGGSIGWRDRGGALRVGPRSAGAEPGPACYGRGGTEPTVTDANLALGYLSDRSPLAGGVALDREAGAAALGSLGAKLGLSEIETAAGIRRVANQEMVRALRVVTVERGVDPRRFALLPFGGAGPMHAAAVAEELEIERILCPRASGVLSALGLVASERRRDLGRTVMLAGPELTRDRLTGEIDELVKKITAGLEQPRVEISFELRYRGQAFELPVALPDESTEPDPVALAEAFASEHEARYGYRDSDAEVELVNLRVAAVEPGPEPRIEASSSQQPERSGRRAWFDGEWLDASVVRGDPPAGFEIEGPSVLELPEATLVLPPGWTGETDTSGTVVAHRSGK